MGAVTLPLRFGELVSQVKFYIIDADTSYKALIGRPWLHENNAEHDQRRGTASAYSLILSQPEAEFSILRHRLRGLRDQLAQHMALCADTLRGLTGQSSIVCLLGPLLLGAKLERWLL